MKKLIFLLPLLALCGCTGNYRPSATVTEFEQRYEYAKLQSDTLEAEGTRLRIYHDKFPRITGDGRYSTELRIYSLSTNGDQIVSQRNAVWVP